MPATTPPVAPTWLTVGTGEPLIVLPGLSRAPQTRTFAYAGLARVTGRQVHVLNRPTGLARGISLEYLAGLHAAAIAERFPEPVDLMGASTGGVIGLQLTLDHPRLVRRLVLATAASWLGERGRQQLRAFGDEVEAGRSGAAILGEALGSPGRTWLMKAVVTLFSFLGRKQSPNDMLATIDAEVAFDVTSRLGEIAVPTLLIAGGQDHAFPLPLMRATADAIPQSRLIVYPNSGHIGVMFNRRFGPDIAAFLSGADH